MSCDLPISALEASLVRPTWADPRWMIAANDATYRDYTFATMDPEMIAAANPRRWAIGFVQPDLPALDIRLGPWSDALRMGWQLNGAINGLWFTAFEFGPLVSRSWWAITAEILDVVRVIEIVIN